ncbi:MAG: hypothetical protein J6X22_01770 [Muribaculaceae bacterium]|nr:hypothetical protein [Muribaculaceae bacterium]
MAKKKNQQTRTKLEEVNDSLSGIEQKFEQHKNLIYIIVAAILVIAFFLFAYVNSRFFGDINWGHKYEVEKAQTEIAKADDLLLKSAFSQGAVTAQDSTNALQVYETVAKKYGHNLIFKNDVGNRAKLMAAQILYARDKFADAQKYLEDYSPKGKIVGPTSQILLGDSYVNQKMYDKAVKAYDNAVDLSKDSFWDTLTWKEIALFVLALFALIVLVVYATRKNDSNRKLAMIISAIIFLLAAGFLAYLISSNKDIHENRSLIPYALQKKANVLDAQQKYDEEIKIYEELETKYTGPGSMTMQIERATAKKGGK